jgi:hypothetical protein
VKIGEALTLRSQLQIRFQQLRERLKACVLVQEGENPPEDPEELLTELQSVGDQLAAPSIAHTHRAPLYQAQPGAGLVSR